MVRLSEVAEACGVDISTVSRALRDDPRVKDATKQVVADTAQRLGYRPNLHARSLKTGKTGVVLFFLNRFDSAMETGLAEKAAKALLQREYDLVVAAHHGDPVIWERFADRLIQGMGEGALVLPEYSENHVRVLERLCKSAVPLVFLDRLPEGLSAPVVTTDNAKAATDLAQACLDAGAERLVFVQGADNSVERARLQGVRDLAQSLKIPFETLSRESVQGVVAKKTAAVGSSFSVIAERLARGERFLHVGVFDGWHSPLHPSGKIFICTQEIEGIAQCGAEILLRLMEGKKIRKKQTSIPYLKIEVAEVAR